jgi:hypothetical protein
MAWICKVDKQLRGFAAVVLLGFAAVASAQIYEENLPLEHPAVLYGVGPSDDPVARLAKKLESREVELDFHRDGLSYLPSLLEKLGVSVDSQVLVFSKTSAQQARISPAVPRAIYFGDDVSVGFVPGSETIEIAAVDPRQGVLFYTLSAAKTDSPRFLRPGGCLECHQGPATLGVPGIYVGSVGTSLSGRADFRGSIVSDHRTPFADRWGGWYVTSALGPSEHHGNSFALHPADYALSPGKALNLESLQGRLDASRYPSPVSDIVALMTLEHQTQMTNLFTRLAWEARIAEHEESQAGLTARVDEVVAYMLFEDEVPLEEPIRGVSTFAASFARRGPRDSRGRSLRDFDLERRLFRYPLSYMVYSEAFDALPDSVRDRVYRRLFESLTDREGDAVLSILKDTKPGLPAYFK